METTVTGKNMVSIPRAIAVALGVGPGWKLDWRRGEAEDELVVRVIPDRAEAARRLMGSGARYGAGRDAAAELVAERAAEG